MKAAIANRALALAVSRHKAIFFAEKNTDGAPIDYEAALSGALQLIPDDKALGSLSFDYAQMVEDGLLFEDAESFDELLELCRDVQERTNRTGWHSLPAKLPPAIAEGCRCSHATKAAALYVPLLTCDCAWFQQLGESAFAQTGTSMGTRTCDSDTVLAQADFQRRSILSTTTPTSISKMASSRLRIARSGSVADPRTIWLRVAWTHYANLLPDHFGWHFPPPPRRRTPATPFHIVPGVRHRQPILCWITEEETTMEDAALHPRVAKDLVHPPADAVLLVRTSPTTHSPSFNGPAGG